MRLILLISLIVIACLLTQYSTFVELFTGFGQKHPSELAPFINFNLTDKPVDNYAPHHIYQWWKYGHDLDKYDHCDQYRCQTKEFNGYNAVPGFNMINGKYVDPTIGQQRAHDCDAQRQCAYFENSAKYCAAHPEDERCPNYRIPKYIDVKRSFTCRQNF